MLAGPKLRVDPEVASSCVGIGWVSDWYRVGLGLGLAQGLSGLGVGKGWA